MLPAPRVLSVPAVHPYVAAVTAQARTVAGPDDGWGPPSALDPERLPALVDGFDVLHVHFGFDAVPVERLEAAVGLLRASGRRLVVTVHDLTNPHHTDPTLHRRQLDVLLAAADRVLTLTAAAAAEVRARWHRHATVVAHPSLLPEAALRAERPTHQGTVVGLHLKSLRPNLRVEPVLRALLGLLADRPDVRLQVGLHREALEPGFPRADAGLLDLLRGAAADGRLTLDVHDRLSDDALTERLLGTDLLVLPYSHGTHSGLLELCHDVGTTALLPADGAWVEQRPCRTFRWGPDLADDLAAALDSVRAGGPGPRAEPERRLRERSAVASAHATLYADLVPAVTA